MRVSKVTFKHFMSNVQEAVVWSLSLNYLSVSLNEILELGTWYFVWRGTKNSSTPHESFFLFQYLKHYDGAKLGALCMANVN